MAQRRATGWRKRGARLAGWLLLGFLSLGPVRAAADEASPAYLRAIDDLPLMPKLAEVEDEGVVFDKPMGRIVISLAQGEVGEAEVAAFYAATLPQLGWTPEGKTTFRREGEVLRITFEGRAPLLVRFSLSPD